MSPKEISNEKIYSALRSVYRYREMVENNAPDILIELESELLEKRFVLLNAAEIFILIKFWPQYLTQQSTMNMIDDKRFKEYLITVN